MLGVGDGLMPGPHPLMISDHRAVTVHADPVQIGDHFDAAPDHPGMHRVVIGVQPDVMIARQPCRGAPPRDRWHRRHGEHRLPVRADPIRRGTSQHPASAAVHHRQPLLHLVVEIAGAAECSARQKRPLQIIVGPFDDALMLRLAGFEDHHLRPENAAERLTIPGQLRAPATPPTDRAFTVPHQRPTPTSAAPHPTPTAAATTRRTGPQPAATGSGSRKATANTRAPSLAPVTASVSGPAHSPPVSILAETTRRTAQYRQPHTWSAQPDPAAHTPAATPAPAP